ncbi:hypothetical protein D6774_04175 [Candidatus Woesearchaeota archaeon]|nr:MAG: hypothetical protein D6774_04175 [Candidatus Woesearchaeota archaeon]
MEDKLLEVLLEQDEITWQSILVNLIKTEEMDPWDVNLNELTSKFIKTVESLKKADLRVSGKVLLAAAILLRIKSTRLVGEDLAAFDSLMAGVDEEELLYTDESEFEQGEGSGAVRINLDGEELRLIPKTPQPRKRKVSIYDLTEALSQALNVTRRRVRNRLSGPEVKIPEKKVDITELMDDVYRFVYERLYGTQRSLKFSEIIPSESKEDKVLTFIPLLHLSNARKVDLFQEAPFADFDVKLSQTTTEGTEDKVDDLEIDA